jgi:hypothetical protein
MPPAVERAAAFRPRWELADVFRLHGKTYRRNHMLPAAHLKVMRDIEVCRTDALGGHLERCDRCAFERPSYNSCRNRHCAKCGAHATQQWLERQKAELLPVPHFHLVFTLPHELNPLVLVNKKVLFNILFKAVSETLIDFGRTHLHGKLGFLAILHTWDQTLGDHFHLHCLIPGGALAFDQSRWIPARENFLFHVHALSIVFRAKFLDFLNSAVAKGTIQFCGRAHVWSTPPGWRQLEAKLRSKKWVVYAKAPFSSPETVLDYLGRYTHRVAISNHRIVDIADGNVTFLYRDRQTGQHRPMTLNAEEFIRRFLLHVLPKAFQRVRHFGFLANRSKKKALARCIQLLVATTTVRQEPQPSAAATPQPTRCPNCGLGVMVVCGPLQPRFFDSS